MNGHPVPQPAVDGPSRQRSLMHQAEKRFRKKDCRFWMKVCEHIRTAGDAWQDVSWEFTTRTIKTTGSIESAAIRAARHATFGEPVGRGEPAGLLLFGLFVALNADSRRAASLTARSLSAAAFSGDALDSASRW